MELPARPPPLLGRPALDVAVDVVRAGIYVALVLWAWSEPAGTGAFVFGGFVFADISSWFIMSLTENLFRPAGFTIEFVGFAAFLGLLSRVGALEIPVGREGEALGIFFLSYLATALVRFASYWLRRIAEELEDG